MKNLLFRITFTFSIFSLSLFSAKLGLTNNYYVYGSNSTRPDSLKVTFYEIGLTASNFNKVFTVLSSSGVEANIADPNSNSLNNLVSDVHATPGTFTHFYAVVSNTFKVKGSSNGCYTKNVTVNHTDKIFFANVVTKNGALWLTNWEFDGYPAASPNSSEFGEATLTEQVYGVGPDGESDQPTANDAYGPVTPATNVSVGGNEVLSAKVYLTNSSDPYNFVPPDTLRINIPAASTRNRSLYVGELSTPVTVKEGSKGIVQLYFDIPMA